MNGDRLKRAREIRGWTQSELSVEIGASQSAVARIEQGLFEPSSELLYRIAMATGFPVAFFQEESSLDFPLGSLLFRKYQSLRSKDRSKVLQMAWATYTLFDFLAKRLRMPLHRLPRLDEEGTATAAQIVRSALGIEPDAPVRNLINRLERAGVVVLSLPVELHEIDAFSMWADRKRPVIVLVGGKPPDRIRRSLAHELAHLVLHPAISGSLKRVEKEADEFASEFLMPATAAHTEIRRPVTLTSLAELKPRWGIAIQSLVERAHELHIITPDQRKYLWKQISIRKWRTAEPILLQEEKPRAMMRMAELLYRQGDTLDISRLAREARLPTRLVSEILSNYEGGRKDDPAGASVVDGGFPVTGSGGQKLALDTQSD